MNGVGWYSWHAMVLLFGSQEEGGCDSGRHVVCEWVPVCVLGGLQIILNFVLSSFPDRHSCPDRTLNTGGTDSLGCVRLQVHQAVVASGARFSGPTIHFVDEEYDTGEGMRGCC